MTNKTLVIACAAILAGCAVAAEPAKPTGDKPVSSRWADKKLLKLDAAGCVGTECVIAVRIRDCKIGISPYYLVVDKRDVKLRWVIQDKGYTFADDGLSFKEHGSPGAKEEFRCGRTNPTTWQCIDRNSRVGAYFYAVKVLKPDGKTACTLDPVIINDNGVEEWVP